MRLFTTTEAADYLRLKERKLYELVAEGAIPCTKVTGKWLFPQAELDRWLAASLTRPKGMPAAEPVPIVGGSHDPLLEWALRESGSGLATLPEGSEAGLARFEHGEIVATALHLHALSGEGDANVAALRGRASFSDAVLIAFARREQGLLLAPGNPLRLGAIEDAVRARARIAVRPKGAGAQLLAVVAVDSAGLGSSSSRWSRPARPVRTSRRRSAPSRADCGIATRAVAAGLDFVTLTWERFDLAMRQRDYFRLPLQALMRFVAAPAFATRARELTGYDVADAGQVRSAP